MKLNLKIWRQPHAQATGSFQNYTLEGVSPEMSFLEMLDYLNENLIQKGQEPVEFDSDCREGICGSCGFMINGQAHGPQSGTTVCQLHLRTFQDGDSLVLEPWRAKAFPLIRDLVVDRAALDRIVAVGGYTGAKTGPHPDANSSLIPKSVADQAMDAAACIGCGACVAACPNASVSLFTAAKVAQFALLPQGHPLREQRVERMVQQMDQEGFGNCTNIGECRAACPKEISIDHIALMKREYLKGWAKSLSESQVERSDSGG